MLTTTFVYFGYHTLYLRQSWFCISSIKHKSFPSKWQSPLQGNWKHGLACHFIKSDNCFSHISSSGNPNNQACLSCVLSFNVLLIFTLDSFLTLLAEIQCHKKPLSKPCTNCSSAVLSGASVNCILRWCDLQLTVNKFSRIIDFLRGRVESLCIYRQPCCAWQHDTHFPTGSFPCLGSVLSAPVVSEDVEQYQGALASRVMGSFWLDPRRRAIDKEQRRLQPSFEWSCCWFLCLGSVFSRGLCTAVKIRSMGRERDCLAHTAAVLSWAL